MNGIREEAAQGTAPASFAVAQRPQTRARLRPPVVLAVVWVIVGAALYLAEILRLVTALG